MPLDARHVDLPVELVQKVLKLCEPETWTTLMLLSKSWRYIVEIERYGAIHVVFDPSPWTKGGAHRQLQLFTTLEHSPRLASRVQSLTFDMRMAWRTWSERGKDHNPTVDGYREGTHRRLLRQMSTLALRGGLIRKWLSWAGIVRQCSNPHHAHSESTLQKEKARGALNCGIRANDNTTVFLAAVALALKHCVNLHTLDLRDEMHSPVLYGHVLLVAINSSKKLRHITLCQSFIATKLLAPCNKTACDGLPHALRRLLSHKGLDDTDYTPFGSDSTRTRDRGRLLAIDGTAGWTPLQLRRLRWFSTEGVSVIARQGSYALHIYVSHYRDATWSDFEQYITDVSEYCESLWRSRDEYWMYLPRWHALPQQIQVSLLAEQLNSHLETTIGAVSSVKPSVKSIKLVFCTPDDSNGTGEPPRVSATRLVEMLAPLQKLQKVILWNEMRSKADYAIRASRQEVLAAGRTAGMKHLEEVVFFGEPWLFGCRYSV